MVAVALVLVLVLTLVCTLCVVAVALRALLLVATARNHYSSTEQGHENLFHIKIRLVNGLFVGFAFAFHRKYMLFFDITAQVLHFLRINKV
jgi:hypothetical protein